MRGSIIYYVLIRWGNRTMFIELNGSIPELLSLPKSMYG